jgi:hypothetical protein
MSKTPAFRGISGGFVKVKRSCTEDQVTLWIEGRDQDGPSVSGLALDLATAERFLARFTAVVRTHRRKASS